MKINRGLVIVRFPEEAARKTKLNNSKAIAKFTIMDVEYQSLQQVQGLENYQNKS